MKYVSWNDLYAIQYCKPIVDANELQLLCTGVFILTNRNETSHALVRLTGVIIDH